MESQIDNYWEKYLGNFSFEERLQSFRQRKAGEVLSALKLPAPTILEIGPGLAPIFEVFRDYSTYVGLEPGSIPFRAMNSKACGDTRIVPAQLSLEQADEFLAPFKFDFITCSGVLGEGGVDPESFLRKIEGLMGRDTVCYLNVPNSNSLHRVLGKEAGLLNQLKDLSPRQDKLGVRELYGLDDLKALVTRVIPSSVVIETGSFFLKFLTHEQLEQALSIGILSETMIEALYAASGCAPYHGAEIFITFRLSR